MHTTAKKPRKQKKKIATDPAEAAEEAGLRYVSDDQPGYTRKAKGDDFEYFDIEGKAVGDEQRLFADQAARHSAGLDRCLDFPVG